MLYVFAGLFDPYAKSLSREDMKIDRYDRNTMGV